MYDTILVPYDGSDGAAAALHHAGEIAHWADATVRVLYVADTTRDSITVIEGRTVDVLIEQGEEIVAEATEILESLGVAHGSDVVQGPPAKTIAEYATEYEQDLIVIPTHGRSGISRFLLGSVSERVVRHSSVPVITVRMQPDEQLTFPYERILVPIDGSDTARYAAKRVSELAGALDATLHILSVVDNTGLEPDIKRTVTEARTEHATTTVEAVADMATDHGVTDIVHEIKQGRPVEVIREYSTTHGIHLIGMGTTGRHGAERVLLGSVAERTVRSAPMPVMTIRKP